MLLYYDLCLWRRSGPSRFECLFIYRCALRRTGAGRALQGTPFKTLPAARRGEALVKEGTRTRRQVAAGAGEEGY